MMRPNHPKTHLQACIAQAANCEFIETNTHKMVRCHWNNCSNGNACAKSDLEPFERNLANIRYDFRIRILKNIYCWYDFRILYLQRYIAWCDIRILYLLGVNCLVWFQDSVFLESILPGMLSGPFFIRKHILESLTLYLSYECPRMCFYTWSIFDNMVSGPNDYRSKYCLICLCQDSLRVFPYLIYIYIYIYNIHIY